MDGFQIGKKFFCKELGVIKVGDSEASSFFFDIGLHWNELNEKDKRTCNFVQKNIHRLPFGVPRGTKAFQISDLQAIVENFYREIQIDSNSTNLQLPSKAGITKGICWRVSVFRP